MKKETFQLIKKVQSVTSRGFLLVEVILASSLFVIFLTAFLGAYLYGEEASAEAGNRVNAIMYAESGLEAVRNIRNEDFLNLISGQHGLVFSSGTWNFSGIQDTSSIFTRTIVISSSTEDRVSATTTVTWQQNSRRSGSVSLSRVFSNWLDLRYWYFPGIVSKLGLPDGGDKVQVVGNYAYVTGALAPTLYVINVTSSSSPSIAELPLPLFTPVIGGPATYEPQ